MFSYDIVDVAPSNVPPKLAESRWSFVQGDVRRLTDKIPEHIDWLFMDSDHSASFAEWYLNEVFPRVKAGGVIAVDDVYHYEDPGEFDGEGEVLAAWLEEKGVEGFCASSAGFKTEQNAINAVKLSLGLGDMIRPATKNPTVFFEAPSAKPSA